MPELPEVQTTVNGLNKTVRGRKIIAVSTNYNSQFYKGKDEIKNPKFFAHFKRKVQNKKILGADRRAKNILIHLSGGDTILVHMKMTGHFVYNRPDIKFVRLDFILNNKKHLVLSDMRKFAKVTLIKTSELKNSPHLKHLGPEPLNKKFQFPEFKSQIMKRPKGRIKQVLMDQSIISGIGNIYADEILWQTGVHPLSLPKIIPENKLKDIFKAIKENLKRGIRLGGDSMSDYRNIEGEKGEFQNTHRAYQRTGESCRKKNCRGAIKRLVIGSRAAHFCSIHQKLFT